MVQKEYTPSAAIARRLPSKWPRPVWHAPWRMYRVISGHLGCVGAAPVQADLPINSVSGLGSCTVCVRSSMGRVFTVAAIPYCFCSWVRSVTFDPSNEWFATGSGVQNASVAEPVKHAIAVCGLFSLSSIAWWFLSILAYLPCLVPLLTLC